MELDGLTDNAIAFVLNQSSDPPELNARMMVGNVEIVDEDDCPSCGCNDL